MSKIKTLLEIEDARPIESIVRITGTSEQEWFGRYTHYTILQFCETEMLETEIVPKTMIKYHKRKKEPHAIIHGEGKLEIYLPVKREYISRILEEDDPYKVLVNYVRELNISQETAKKLLKDNLKLANMLTRKHPKYVKEAEKRGISRDKIIALLALHFIELDRILI